MKRWLLIINLILAFFLLVNEDSVPSETRRLRIISLAPSTTEILFALGLDDEVVGVSLFCDYPPKALGKEKSGTFSRPNIEKILSLRPDIIFCTGLEQASVVRELRELNLKVCVSDPSNIKELFDSISYIGGLTNKEKEAGAIIEKMKQGIEEINDKIKLIPHEARPKVFVEIWNDPLMTAGGSSFINELVSIAGGVNIACDVKRAYSYFGAESVIKRNPDFIILAYMTKEKPLEMLKERVGWKDIAAVKNNRIYNDIDPDVLIRPGPRVIDGIREVHKRLYPSK